MSTYIGLTIGPISKVLGQAKGTGELWGSSYIFSYIMKSIIKKLIRSEDRKNRFIAPYVEDETIFEGNNKVGLFYDRFIFQSKENDFEDVQKFVKEVKQELASAIQKDLNSLDKDKVYVVTEDYIDNFFKIYFIEVEVQDSENIIKEVSKYLDVLELKENYLNKEEDNSIYKILENSKVKKSFLSKDAYGKNFKGSYPSLYRIAATEALNEEKKSKFNDAEGIIDYNEDKKIEEKLLELGRNIKKYHKYAALVQVDGDNIGEIIKKLKVSNNGDKYKEYKEFSKCLLTYAQSANEIIKKYDGFTIYAGGDDLLFLAPIFNKGANGESKDIFQVFKELDEVFNKIFENYKDITPKPSLSFGVSLVNHKFPLYLTLEETVSLLIGKAKKYSREFVNGAKKKKHSIAIKVIKSSGKSFESIFNLDSSIYSKYTELFNKYTAINEGKSQLNQIHIKLYNHKKIISKLLEDKDTEGLKNYFNNNFNENIHDEEKIKEFIDEVREYIACYTELAEATEEDIENVYSSLKIIRFMNEDTDVKDGDHKNE